MQKGLSHKNSRRFHLVVVVVLEEEEEESASAEANLLQQK